MDQQSLINLHEVIVRFIMESHHEMMANYGIDTRDVRVSFPRYLTRYFVEGMVIKGYACDHEFKQICGIDIVPAYDNVITVYHVDGMIYNIPIYRMQFNQYESYLPKGLVKVKQTYVCTDEVFKSKL